MTSNRHQDVSIARKKSRPFWRTLTACCAIFVSIAGGIAIHYCVSAFQDKVMSTRITAAGGAFELGARRDIYGRQHIGRVGFCNVPLEDSKAVSCIPGHWLEILDLKNTKVGSNTIRYLSKNAPNLTSLQLDGTEIDDDDLRYLSNLPITELSLDNTRIGDTGLSHLAKSGTLRWISARGTHVTKEGAKTLTVEGKCEIEWSTSPSEELRKAVVGLQRRGAHVSVAREPLASRIRRGEADAAFYSISLLNNWLPDDAASRGDLAFIVDREWVDIFLRFKDEKKTDGIAGLSKIRRLVFDSHFLRDSSLSVLDKIGSLQALSLDSPNITDEGMVYLCKLSALEDLRIDAGVTDNGVRELRCLNKLRSLTLRGPEFTDGVLLEIKEHHPNLERLTLQCPHISLAAVESLRRDLPRLEVKYEPNMSPSEARQQMAPD